MSTNFNALTDGTDQNIGTIDDSIGEFFARSQALFERQKRRELGLDKRAPMPAYKPVDFPRFMYRGGVNEATGEPSVESILIPLYADDKHENGYPVADSGMKRSKTEKERKLGLGYVDSLGQAKEDAETAAIAYRKQVMEDEETAKLGAVQRVWGTAARPAAVSQDVLAELLAKMDRMQEQINAHAAAKAAEEVIPQAVPEPVHAPSAAPSAKPFVSPKFPSSKEK